MAYVFDVLVAPDVRLTHKSDTGLLRIECDRPDSLFNLVEELQMVQTFLLDALGYGKKEEE